MSEELNNFTLNRLNNPNSQFSIGNWVAFADAAATSPADGTGGSPNSTITRTETTPLDGIASLLFTKNSGASRQGEGASTDFVIQPSDATKVFTLSVDYQITTGTYTEGTATTQSDLTWWFYDVTNAVMYQMTPSNINGSVSTTNQYNMQAQVQIPVGCLTGRLIMYIPTTTNASCTLRFNNISFGRQPRVQGTIETPWQTYTPSSALGGLGTLAAVNSFWRRIGTDMFIQGNFTTGTVGTSLACVSIPSGYSIDNSATGFSTGVVYAVGNWARNATGEGNQGRVLIDGNSLGFGLLFGAPLSMSASGFTPFIGVTTSSAFANAQLVKFNAQIPILGWGTAGTIGQDADTRVVAAKYAQSTTYMLPLNTAKPYQFNTLAYDTHAAATYGAGVTFTYYVPVAGIYQFALSERSANSIAVAANGDICRMSALLNGTSFIGSLMAYTVVNSAGETKGRNTVGWGSGQFVTGDALTFTAASDGASYFNTAGTALNWVTINRLSGPAQVQASEIITARYSSNAGQSITNNSVTVVNYEDITYDDHNCVTVGAAWQFACPRAGKLRVSAKAQLASNAGWGVGEIAYLSVFKNAAEYGRGEFDSPVTATIVVNVSVDDEVMVVAGDLIDIRIYQNSGGTIAMTATSVLNFVSINYIGGF